MGTSGSSGGSGSNTSLLPTWLADPPAGPLPGAPPDAPSDGADDDDGNADSAGEADDGEASRPPIQRPPEPARFQGARRNFSAFAGSGGNDRNALRRSARDYVRSGTRGSTNAVRRMGSSRVAAGNLLGVLRGIQRDGLDTALRNLNLANLVGRAPSEIFIGLTEIVCGADGGPIDEAIARDAWLETIAELDRYGITDANLTADQVRDIFTAFVAHSVEALLFEQIGVNGLSIARDLEAIELFEGQLRSYIERAVQDSFSTNFDDLSAMSDADIRAVVDTTYRDAWDLLVAWGDQVE